MDKYIRVNDAYREIRESELLTDNNKEWAVEAIRNAPVVDVEPVIYAKWEMVDKEGIWIQGVSEALQTGEVSKRKQPVCSHCKTSFGRIVLEFKRCPECGAKMVLK